MPTGQKRELFTWYGAQSLYDMVYQTKPVEPDFEGVQG